MKKGRLYTTTSYVWLCLSSSPKRFQEYGFQRKSIEDLVQDGEIVDRQVHGLAEAIVRDRKGSACENDSSDSSSDLERDKISKSTFALVCAQALCRWVKRMRSFASPRSSASLDLAISKWVFGTTVIPSLRVLTAVQRCRLEWLIMCSIV